MCEQAGITGQKMNHSLRATGVTKMYESGAPEKVISGHRSLEGLRSHERISTQQHQAVSNILSHTQSHNYEGQYGFEHEQFISYSQSVQCQCHSTIIYMAAVSL